MSNHKGPPASPPILFDDFERDWTAPANAGESLYSFYNRSSLDGFSRVRAMLQRWIERLPDEHRRNFVSRMRHKGPGSRNENQQFNGAFVELFVHEFLKGTNPRHVTIEPKINGLTPDFQVIETLSNGSDVTYVVEVTDINLDDEPDRSTDRNERYVIDVLNEIISPNYSLHIETYGSLSHTPRKRDIKQPFEELIKTTDYEEALLRSRIPGDFFDVMPAATVRLGDWTLIGYLMPVSPEHTPKTGRFVGGYPSKDAAIPNHKAPRDRLDEKAQLYRHIDNLIIAARFTPWDVPMDQLLFGLPDLEALPYGQPNVGRTIPQPSSAHRGTGFWLDTSGLRHQNVIGVVAFHTLNLHCTDKTTAVYYPNPYKDAPLPRWATAITHANYSDGELNIVQGLPPCAFATDYEIVQRPFG